MSLRVDAETWSVHGSDGEAMVCLVEGGVTRVTRSDWRRFGGARCGGCGASVPWPSTRETWARRLVRSLRSACGAWGARDALAGLPHGPVRPARDEAELRRVSEELEAASDAERGRRREALTALSSLCRDAARAARAASLGARRADPATAAGAARSLLELASLRADGLAFRHADGFALSVSLSASGGVLIAPDGPRGPLIERHASRAARRAARLLSAPEADIGDAAGGVLLALRGADRCLDFSLVVAQGLRSMGYDVRPGGELV